MTNEIEKKFNEIYTNLMGDKEKKQKGELENFQKATVDRVLKRFDEGQKRMLVADEVGMGKTKVAKGVLVGLLKEHIAKKKNEPFVCVYVCNNAAVAQKNIAELQEGVKEISNIPKFDRLSMVANFISEMNNAAKNEDEDKDKILQLIPLTPETSFTLDGNGRKEEREFIYSVLYHNGLKKIKYLKKRFKISQDRIKKFNIDERRIKTIIKKATPLVDGKDENLVLKLRKIFAKIGLEMLNPDFVIMDEFQKFSSLLVNDENNESTMIAKEFFKKKDLSVLLLSATPYPKYTSNQDIANQGGNGNIQRNDFSDIFDFLTGKENGIKTKGKAEQNTFDTAWNNWSQSFEKIMKCETTDKGTRIDDLKTAKKNLETAMYDYVCRTERSSVVNNNKNAEQKTDKNIEIKLEPDEDDVQSYMQAQEILNAADLPNCRKFPIEWIKSCPYALSFMDYDLRKKIERNIKNQRKNYPLQWLAPVPNPDKNNGKSLLKEKNLLIYNYKLGDKDHPYPNAAFREMVNLIFEESDSEKLLWVPPSLPYYQPSENSVFSEYYPQKDKQKNFTKTLVFSSWAVVPKMLACLLTYEAERRNVGKGVKYYPGGKEGSLTKLLKKLLIGSDKDNIITFLAKFYKPQKYYRKELSYIIADLEKKKTNGDTLIALAAIASPAVCLYRTFKRLFEKEIDEKEIDDKKIAEIASTIIHRFSTPVNRCLIEAAVKKGKSFGEKLLWYCADGNFQAMIDEYAHMLKPSNAEDLYNKMKAGLGISATTYDISVNNGNARVGKERFKSSLRSLFAAPFLQGNGEKDANRKKHLGDAFNSPFRPFVLASTSIGQEGLDFHKYCRRIVHWNLSDNPIDFEQREGRVNRHKNLSVRQTLAARYGQEMLKTNKIDVWKALFDKALNNETSEEEAGLIPYWILKDNGLPKVEIESKVFLYPASKEEEKFKKLNNRLLYHVVFGQKRQEELVKKMQELGWKNEDVKELMFNLSPFDKKNGN